MSVLSAPWKLKETEFPQTGTPTEQLKFLLNYRLLAFSWHNIQPWNFKINNETILWQHPMN